MLISAPRPRHRKRFVVTLALLACVPLWTACTAPTAARKPLTLATLHGPNRVDFNGAHVSDLKWAADGLHYLERRGDVLQQVDVVTGEATPAYDYEALEDTLKAGPDFDPAAAVRVARHPAELSADRTVALLEHNDRLYFYRFAERTLKRLTDEPAARREVTLSPDHAYVAFVLDNNLFTIDTATGQTTQLTHDGSDTLLNGVLDWVYQEELYGRGNWRAYWWSDDGRHIAYLQLNEANVPVYPLVDYLPIHPTTESLRYPKAGDPNPKVRLGVVQPAGGDTTWIDLTQYDGTDILITRVSWSPDGRVIYGVQDRESRWLDLNAADPEQGAPRTLIHETSPAWVEYETPPKWLPDGAFLWLSARDGWQHLYLYTRDGELLRRVTAGEWEVRDLLGMDPDADCVYFSATRDSPVETHVYRTQLAGSPIERLTTPGFSHRVSFAPYFRYFIDTFSSVTTPTRVDLRRADGALVRTLSTNDVPALREYRLSTPEFLRVPTPAGHALNALIIRPPQARPHQKYPVLTFVYGGPHMPIVHNCWDGDDYIFQQWLAAQGYIVWVCDPYSASGEGAVSAWHAHQRLGVTELADLEASLHWLAAHENADLSRVGIIGHSYGGYLAAYALTHSQMFKMGIAGSALTDWRNYDSVYAERLMRTPEHNPDGYAAASAVNAAGNLHGRLLLVHGALDDNVHLPNLMQFIHAAEEANKEFDLMIYPADGHGIYGPHWDRLQIEFIQRNL